MTELTTTTFWQVLQRALASGKAGGVEVTLTTDAAGLGAAGALTTLSRLKLKEVRHFWLQKSFTEPALSTGAMITSFGWEITLYKEEVHAH